MNKPANSNENGFLLYDELPIFRITCVARFVNTYASTQSRREDFILSAAVGSYDGYKTRLYGYDQRLYRYA